MWDFFGPYEEIIDRVAFDKTLAANPDVSFLENHRGLSMARTTNDTLALCMGDLSGRTGLKSDAWLNPKRSDVSNLVIAIEDRIITEMSFAFMLNEGWWSEDFETFKITEADINRGDVSAVNYGANPFTSISARSARDIMRELDNLPLGAARAAMSRLSDRTARLDQTDPNIGGVPGPDNPHNFLDVEKDGVCDICGEPVDAEIHDCEPDADDKGSKKPKKPKYAADPNQPHKFVDADGDGKCDVCGKAEGAEIHDPEPDADDPSSTYSAGRKVEDVERAIGQAGRKARSIIHVEALLAVAEKEKY
jgi:HK97 family phage prohead protease